MKNQRGQRYLVWAVALGSCLSAASACGDSADPSTAEESTTESSEETIELYSWWIDGGERDALYAVLDVNETEHPETTVVNVAELQAEQARETLTARMDDGDPPDTFQANIGAGLLDWLGDGKQESPLLPLNDLAQEQGWFDVLPDELVSAASRDGNLYGVPLNVHRINSLFYNKRLFDEHGLTPPTSLQELKDLVVQIATDEEIQGTNAAGVAPLALGNRWDWTLQSLAFESILSAVGGADYYEKFWTGQASPDDPELIQTLDEALFLYCGAEPENECAGYFNPDVSELTWSEGVRLLASGSAAMAVMGDWAKGYFEDQRLVAEEDFGVVPFPGSAGTFVFTADTFPLTRGAKLKPTRELLTTFGSVEGQVAFNSLKGSIPARTDIDPSDYMDAFDAMDVRTMGEFREGRRVLAMSGLVPSDTMPDLGAQLKASFQAGTTETVLNYLQENYDSLK